MGLSTVCEEVRIACKKKISFLIDYEVLQVIHSIVEVQMGNSTPVTSCLNNMTRAHIRVLLMGVA